MKNYKAIIFDFDGVLFDSEKIHLKACNQIFETLGFSISETEYFERYVGLSDNEMFRLILNEKNISYTAAQSLAFVQNKIRAYQRIINQCESLEGVTHVKKFLESYSRKTNHFAICSGASRDEIDSTLDRLEAGRLKKYFKQIISINDISRGKPSPEGYLLAAQRLNMLPEHCLAIEDTPVGIAAAKNAGMDVIALTTTHHQSKLTQADFIANHYDEISAWLTPSN